MRVPLRWLNDYVSVEDLEPEALGQRLSLTGTKLEAVHRPGAGIENIRVAEVTGIDKHPNADNLSMVDIDTGAGAERVVCGAKNFAVGDKVPYAAVGSKLPGLEITARKIRGETSRGMLCSAAELGISKDSAGLLILPPGARVGADVVELLGLDGVILEFEITPNRPDCMSIVGIAREVAALYGRELIVPSVEARTDRGDTVIEVDIQDSDGCPRYLASRVSGVRVGTSPDWMAARLLAAGVRPISNVVDATNYVLMELGQPMHAFDASKIDTKIVVRRALDGERLVTLDGVERELRPGDLVIADVSKPLALAGVMGGESSEVSNSTTDVILECAAFDSASVSFTSRRHGLRSEASARFERGTDIEAIPLAAARCAELMVETADGKATGTPADEYPKPYEPSQIVLRPRRTGVLLGIDIPAERQLQHLRSIGLPATASDVVIEVSVPAFRPDLQREADLIEEVARLEGYENLASTVPSGPGGELSAAQKALRAITRALVTIGATEAWTGSFFSPASLDALGLDSGHPARRLVEVSNPMSEHEGALRSTMLPGLLGCVARNTAHQASGVALFEVARVYEPGNGDLAGEELVLGAVFAGARSEKAWNSPETPWDFFAAKGALESAAAAIGVSGLSYASLAQPSAPFHPTRGAAVSLDGTMIGVIGELHPDVCERFEVPQGTVSFEVALEPLLHALPGRRETHPLSRFPSVFIDLALVVDAGVAAGKVEDIVSRAGAPEVASVRLFDVYVGDQVAEGRKSLAFSIEMRLADRTMTDDDAQVVRDRILSAVAERFGAELRG
jgi:phenylalanyl-tRNA synthetase beta chain